MKKILIPTDFSDNAKDALKYALKFVQGYSTHLHILHVVNTNVTSTDDPIANTTIIKAHLEIAQEKMKAIREFCNTQNEQDRKGLIVTTNTCVGSIPNMIKEEAKNTKADLIIMGTRGSNHNVLDKVLGTSSIAVVDQAPCPVFLIPKNYSFKIIENVIYATNLSHGDSYDLWRATEVLNPHTMVIQCLYVAKDAQTKDAVLVDSFSKYMIEHSPSLKTQFHSEVGSDIEEVLSEFAENYEAEILIMHRTKKPIWSKMFGKRHTNKMIRRMELPLLIMNE